MLREPGTAGTVEGERTLSGEVDDERGNVRTVLRNKNQTVLAQSRHLDIHHDDSIPYPLRP